MHACTLTLSTTGEGEGNLFSSSDYLEEEEEGTMFGKQGALFDNVEEKEEEEEEEGVEGGYSDLKASIRSTRSGEEMSHDIHVTCT